jgi:hypothetical protein
LDPQGQNTINNNKGSNNKDNSKSNNAKYPKSDSKVEGFILTAIEQQVKASNAIVAKKMVKKSKKKGVVFQEGVLVTLAILAKIQLSLEPKRLLC